MPHTSDGYNLGQYFLSWTVTNDNYSILSIEDEANAKPMPKFEAFQHYIVSDDDMTLHLHCGVASLEVNLLGPVNLGTVVKVMKSFYLKKLTRKECKELDIPYLNGMNLGETMGDSVYFEGLAKRKNGIWEVVFGS